jgi:hypothetical protein
VSVRASVGVVVAIVASSAGAARAAPETRETFQALKQLTAPAPGFELRCDLGLLATRQLGNGRAGLDLEIAPRPDYWYSVGAAATLRTTAITTITSGGGTVTTTTQSDGFGISARFFKRIGPIVLNAGVVDSAGGAGIELRGFDDRLRLEVLAANWRFSEPREVPRVRVGGSAQWRFLYVQAGVLDAFEDPAASAFVGFGLRWRDPDLLPTMRWLRP